MESHQPIFQQGDNMTKLGAKASEVEPKLDRAMENEAWCQLFPNARLECLIRV